MKISLIITTYNNERYLELSLKSVMRQTRLPDEIIIADDGSRAATAELIERMRPLFSCPIVHIWQEDKGFRKTKILNKAFAKSTGDYLICIDGDIICDRHFIEDHEHFALKGCFSVGSRVRLSEKNSAKIADDGNIERLRFLHVSTDSPFNALRCPSLTPLFYNTLRCRGCNLAFWKDDIVRINGYDERFEGYGHEDLELVGRLAMSGLRNRYLRFAAIEYHLWHKLVDATGEQFKENFRLCNELLAKGQYRTECGMSQYLQP